ncbi:hypothetical protein RNAN_1094 [Rheinheimera nanhaiensis E407-8]|uniref:Uncharacterized protein n=1 Tax=Rheinheimera nanhaiensis E407-8 TaxID=562729 RepID=I1DVP5_9GAMM|nr:hypothetical protein RNAN_1094 [Rheinheimera nanhaiensis E407-8]
MVLTLKTNYHGQIKLSANRISCSCYFDANSAVFVQYD